MKIDEKREILDLSDHMMLDVIIQTSHKIIKRSNKIEEKHYISLEKQKMKTFIENLESELQKINNITLERYDELIEDLSDKILKTKIIKSRKGEKGRIEPIWLNKEIKK